MFSLPMYSFYSNLPFDNISYYGISVKWQANTNNSMIAEITKQFLDLNVKLTSTR